MINQSTLTSMNALWSALIIEELNRLGVEHICIAPGSRSAPLTLAAAANTSIQTHLHFDERGLGFFALGLAKATQQPVAVIVTSGTAVANLMPSVIEARQTGVPLWFLTADRPVELVDCGANQAIQQQHIFGHYPVCHYALPSPAHAIAPAWLLGCIDHAAFMQRQHPGPVHINCPFRDPLYPQHQDRLPDDILPSIHRWLTSDQPWTDYRGVDIALRPEWADIAKSKGIIVAGRITDPHEAASVLHLGQQLGWPVFADIQSQLRFQPGTILYGDLALHHQSYQKAMAQAESLLLFGERLVSKRMQQFIGKHSWRYACQVSASSERLENGVSIHERYVMSIQRWCQMHAPTQPRSSWFKQLHWEQQIGDLINNALPAWNEITLCHQLNQLQEGRLFIGNSLPVRLLDMLGTQGHFPRQIYTNRGASGIDGLIATAAGLARGPDTSPITLLLGDTSTLYDLNSLALLRHLKIPFVMIIVNNNGGNIFDMLPVPETGNVREHYYQLPHNLQFRDIASQFELNYIAPRNSDTFQTAYLTALKCDETTIIECQVKAGAAAEWLHKLSIKIKALPL